MNSSIVYQWFKCVKCGVSMGVAISVGWCVDVDVGSGNGSAGGSLFGIYYGYDMVSSDFFFDGFSVGKNMG